MPRIPRPTAAPLLALLLLAAGGCGKSYTLAPVSGQVTLDGKPLAGAEVALYPVGAAKDGPYASGVTDDQGRYTLSVLLDGGSTGGAVVGENRVTVSRNRLNKGTKLRPKELTGGHDDVPAKYNESSTLTLSVPAGGTDKADFDLKSK